MSRLPAWAVSDAQSVAQEAAPYVEMAPEQRLQLLAAACRAAAKLLALRADAAAALAYEEPLPESSLRVLARLRAAASRPPR